AAFPLQFQLRLDALRQLFIGDAQFAGGRLAHVVRKPRELLVAEREQLLRLGGVVAVDVDDHQSILTPAERITAPQRSLSCFMNAAVSAGPRPIGSADSSARRF